MQESVRGEDVPEPRRRSRRLLVAVLVVVACMAGLVGTGARVDRATWPPSIEVIPGSNDFRLSRAVPGGVDKARPRASTPDPEPRSGDGELEAIGALALALSLAVIVRMADRLPQGHPDRQALAEASGPLRRALYGREVTRAA